MEEKKVQREGGGAGLRDGERKTFMEHTIESQRNRGTTPSLCCGGDADNFKRGVKVLGEKASPVEKGPSGRIKRKAGIAVLAVIHRGRNGSKRREGAG